MIDLTEEQIKELAAKYPDSLINLPNQMNLSEETLNLIAKSVQERVKEPSTLDHVISTVNASKEELGKKLDDKQMDEIEFIYKEASKIWEHTDFFSHADLPDDFQKKDDDADNIKRK